MIELETVEINGDDIMTKVVRDLRSFDSLPDPDKQELAAEILRRSAQFDLPPLSEEELTRAADDVFWAIEGEEAQDA